MNSLQSCVRRVLDEIPSDFGGGCSVSKANLMAWLIRRYHLKKTVDIGVYRGRSLFPQALAHKQFTGGVVYGVDPWNVSEARENDNNALKESIDAFLDKTDFGAIYREVESFKTKCEFDDYCFLVRQTSTNAIHYFDAQNIYFDLIHIDGNHDTAAALADVRLYLPRLKKNGFVIIDDVSWDSVQPAYQVAKAQLTLLYQKIDGPNDYAVFWNNRSTLAATFRTLELRISARP